MKKLIVSVLAIGIISCDAKKKEANLTDIFSNVHIVGAMKDVMWKGELQGKINLDTISNKKGLYGLGPESYLSGELLINNGTTYLSRVISDSTMSVKKVKQVSAPFFVYANVNEWKSIDLASDIKTIKNLETFIDESTTKLKKPFAFKLIGTISEGVIHIQNLPKGTKVSSPEEAHQGQINYNLKNEAVEIIGFFSTKHKGIFTHHDSYIHLHLITKDESKMGHLDDVKFDTMKLYLPIN